MFSRADVAIRYGNALPELPELFVNGLRVDKEQVHLHTMLAFFRTEMSLTRDLALASGLTSKQASRAIAQARPELSGGAGESEPFNKSQNNFIKRQPPKSTAARIEKKMKNANYNTPKSKLLKLRLDIQSMIS